MHHEGTTAPWEARLNYACHAWVLGPDLLGGTTAAPSRALACALSLARALLIILPGHILPWLSQCFGSLLACSPCPIMLMSCPSFGQTAQCQIWLAKGNMHSRGETGQTEERSPPAQELWPWSGLPLLRFTMSISWSAAELEVAGVWPTLPNSSPAYI